MILIIGLISAGFSSVSGGNNLKVVRSAAYF